MKSWHDRYSYYVENYPPHKLHILRFKNLKSNLRVELKLLMKFLDLKIDNDVLECVIKNNSGSFKRKKPNFNLKKFYTQNQKKDIKQAIKQIYGKLGMNSE